jgi:hypothetical protein
MNKWIEVSQTEVNKPFQKKVKGINVLMMISPFDVPTASRFGMDPQNNQFVVEFKYLASDEPRDLSKYQDGVCFEVGKKTGKIFKVNIDHKHFKARGYDGLDISIGLEEAKSEVEHHESDFARNGNVEAIKNFLSGQVHGVSQPLFA